ncbi:hypothetical protein NFI96_015207 [Prochilodus magdalenae]|nr:hypothetical protein NFI96_015207 [Prochilodus magdalenae]
MRCADWTDDVFVPAENNINMQTAFNRTEYIWCFDKVFQEKKCFHMYRRIFGSTPALLTQSKGFFICFINELVLATASC